MVRKSIINDVELDINGNYGQPILFTNPAIRTMLRLANTSKNDIFYDLGSGWGQNVLMAVKEFQVAEAVGIENEKSRIVKSRSRLKKWGIPKTQGRIVKGKYEDLVDGKIHDANLEDATIVFYGLSSDEEFLDVKKFLNKLRDGCKLIYYYNALFPEIMPKEIDFPFYLSVKPFDYTKSKQKWLQKITMKEKSYYDMKLTEDELWEELIHDYDIDGDKEEVQAYKNRFEKLFSNR